MRTIFIILVFSLAIFEHDENFGYSSNLALSTLVEINSNYLVLINNVNLYENIDFKINNDSIN